MSTYKKIHANIYNIHTWKWKWKCGRELITTREVRKKRGCRSSLKGRKNLQRTNSQCISITRRNNISKNVIITKSTPSFFVYLECKMLLDYKYGILSNYYMIKKVLLVLEIMVLSSSQKIPGCYVDLMIERFNFHTALT